MNPERVKTIVRNLEFLFNALKEELDDSTDLEYEDIAPYLEDDVDEFYDDSSNV